MQSTPAWPSSATPATKSAFFGGLNGAGPYSGYSSAGTYSVLNSTSVSAGFFDGVSATPPTVPKLRLTPRTLNSGRDGASTPRSAPTPPAPPAAAVSEPVAAARRPPKPTALLSASTTKLFFK